MKNPTVKLRLSELRARLNRMTQAELAEIAGLSKTSISNLESTRLKRIELSTIAKLCKALKCNVGDLFELQGAFEDEIVQRQRIALKSVLRSLTYDKVPNPDTIDQELSSLKSEHGNKSRSSIKNRRYA